MTRRAILEYARAVSPRYLAANKREKGVILDEFCKTTGHHRKSAVRLLRHPPQTIGRTMGRPRKYGLPVVEALRIVWETSDRVCGKRLAPFIGELLVALERHGELRLAPDVRQQLLTMSAATMDRRLKPYRSVGMRRPYTHRRSPTALQAQIPVRTFGEWAEVAPGSMQLDLVAHCGQSTEGFYLNTLVGVDVATSWSEYEVIWGKGQERVGTGVHKIRQRVPFPLREVHTDNGSEFINVILYPWCKKEGLRFTRGRPYKKNDQAYVEQKNWTGVRQFVGYSRYEGQAACDLLNQLYKPLRAYTNYFQPVMVLIEKERNGAKVKKKYDEAKTPYQRVLESPDVSEEVKARLRKEYLTLNPAALLREINVRQKALWRLAKDSTTE